MNRSARVTQADIARALRAIKQADMPMAIEILPDGVIRIVRQAPAPPAVAPSQDVAEEKIIVF